MVTAKRDPALIVIQLAGGNEVADGNTTTVTINGNGDILGGDDDSAIEMDVMAGHLGGGAFDADNNSTTVDINDNGDIRGDDEQGIELVIGAGEVGGTPGDPSTGNSNTVNITGNGDIIGEDGDQSLGDDGILLEPEVCCSSTNFNVITISGNGDIRGENGDGIDVEQICCAGANFVTIQDNGQIRGNEESGIEYDVPVCGLVNTRSLPALGVTVNILTITGNDISRSGDGDFDAGIEGLVEQLEATDKKALRGARKMINRLIGKPKSSGQKGHPVKKQP